MAKKRRRPRIEVLHRYPPISPNRVKLRYDREWDEWQVITYKNGKQVGSYHADDKEDAIGTMKLIREQLKKFDPGTQYNPRKSMRPGMGGRFAKLVRKLKRRGARSPKALAASIGRRKYGEKAMTRWALQGRWRAKVGRARRGLRRVRKAA